MLKPALKRYLFDQSTICVKPLLHNKHYVNPVFYSLLLCLLCRDFPEDAGTNMQRCCQWTRRLSLYLIGCLYPGANYEREYMALAVLNILLEGLCDCSSVACLVPAGGIRKSSDHDIEALQAFLHPVIFSSGTIKLLLGTFLLKTWASQCRVNSSYQWPTGLQQLSCRFRT